MTLRSWLLNGNNLGGVGADGILTEEERQGVTELNLSGLGLTSLEGLEAFPNLQLLDCSRNSLTQLDLSQNPALVQLYCSNNRLTSLDVSQNMNLEHLGCSFNRITQLDLTGHSKLIALNCEMNLLTSLTLTGCTDLLSMYCRNNLLTSLDLTDNTKLVFIETFDNRLTSIDVSGLANLRFLHIDHNRLTELDMSHNTKLEGGGFVARNNFMEKIYLPNQPGLIVYLDDYEEQDPIHGYDRAAWFLDPEFRTPAPAELEAAGQTLYSQRIPNKYTIYFSANGGNGSIASVPAQWDSDVQLPGGTGLSRYGHTFSKWNTQPKGDGTAYESSQSVRNLAGRKTDGDRITLYAQWTPNQYTIQLNPNGGEGEVKTMTATYGQSIALEANTFTKEGKEFAGWATTPGGAVRYADKAQVQSLTGEADGVVNLYAVWRTPLSEIQKPYLKELETEFKAYREASYTAEDWGKLSSAYADGMSKIQGTESTTVMDRAVETAKEAMEAVLTIEKRVEEITASWRADHKSALDSLSGKNLTESNAQQSAALAQAALADLAQDKLVTRSTLTGEDDRNLVVGKAAEQLQPKADELMTMKQAAEWLESLGGLTLRSMAQVQEEHLGDYQNAISSYNSLDEKLKSYISESVSADLEQRYELAGQKRTETQLLQSKYDSLDQSEYSAKGQAALSSALNKGMSAIRSANSVEAAQQAGEDAWKQISQVLTADQEPVTPPEGGGSTGGGGGGTGGGGGASGGGSAGGGGSATEEPEESVTVTVTDEKTGATAQVTTAPDGKVTAQVTIPNGVDHATIRIPCKTANPGTVAVRILADGTRQVLPRTVYQDGALAVRLDESASIELVDNSKSFSDVAAGDWFAGSVQFTASRELFSGVGSGGFAPYDTMTRSMLVTVLHRLEGSPAPTASGSFQDVPQGTWYSTAADWAAEQGITSGTSAGLFDPNAPITRETLALMLYRCAGSPAAASDGKLEDFQDGEKVSSWAREAMEWACANGILTGDNNGQLRPQADSTRAEVAAMLTRFVSLTTL